MKLFCTFAVLGILAKTGEAMLDSKTCLDEVNGTFDEVFKFFDGGLNPADASDAVKCHFKCVYEKQGVLKDGVYDFMPLFLDKDLKEIRKPVIACTAEKGDNPCDTAYKITICLERS